MERRRLGRHGDRFDREADWTDVLESHGWTLVRESGGEQFWRRPGKGEDHSATVNYKDSGALYVFSSNAAPFEAQQSYTKFGAYAVLEHGGDHGAAARALAQRPSVFPELFPKWGAIPLPRRNNP